MAKKTARTKKVKRKSRALRPPEREIYAFLRGMTDEQLGKVHKYADGVLHPKQLHPGNKTQFRSIREACYHLFETHGPDKVTVEMATELAREVMPTTKFNQWHLYFHRRNYRLDKKGEETRQKFQPKVKAESK